MLILGARRGGPAARAENWKALAPSGATSATATAASWTDPQRRASSRPSSTTTSAATPSSTAPRCSACASATSARCATSTASRRPGRSATTTWSRTTPAAEHAVPRARRARRRPDRAAGRRAAVPRDQPRAAHRRSCASDLEAAGLHPFALPIGHPARRGTIPEQLAVHPLRHLRRLPVPGQRQGRRARDRASTRRCATRTSRCAPMPTSRGWRRRPTAARSPASWSSATGRTERYSADVVVLAAGAINSAALLLRSANDRHPDGLANGSDVVGRNLMLHLNNSLIAFSKEPNPTRVPEDAGRQRLLRRRTPSGGTRSARPPDARQERRLRRSRFDALPGARTPRSFAAHSLDFWLTTEDLPRAENRVLADPDGGISPGLGAHQPGGPCPARPSASRGCSRPCAATARSGATAATSAAGSTSPASPTRTARSASATTRRPRRSTSTAGRTSSTTCTSSTRASSPPARP